MQNIYRTQTKALVLFHRVRLKDLGCLATCNNGTSAFFWRPNSRSERFGRCVRPWPTKPKQARRRWGRGCREAVPPITRWGDSQERPPSSPSPPRRKLPALNLLWRGASSLRSSDKLTATDDCWRFNFGRQRQAERVVPWRRRDTLNAERASHVTSRRQRPKCPASPIRPRRKSWEGVPDRIGRASPEVGNGHG